MLQIKVKTKDVRFSLPIPYAILNIGISILTSQFFHRQMQEWAKKRFERENFDFTIPPIDKKMLKPIVKEMKNHKGLVLIDVKAKDGTEVRVKL